MLGLLRVLHHARGHSLPRDTVVELLQPKSIRSKEHADTLAANTILAVKELSSDELRLLEE